MDKGFDRTIRIAVYVVALAMVAYHMLSAYGILLGSIEHQTVHLAFIFGLTFLVVVRSSASPVRRLIYLAFFACGMFVTAYVYINLDTLEQNVGFPAPTDVAVGILMIILAFEGTRQAWGWILPIVALVFVASLPSKLSARICHILSVNWIFWHLRDIPFNLGEPDISVCCLRKYDGAPAH